MVTSPNSEAAPTDPTRVTAVVRSRLDGRGQSGLTLMEMIVVVGLITVLTATVTTWAMATTVANMRTENLNKETSAFSLVNSDLLRDISSAQFATSTNSKRPPVADPSNPSALAPGGPIQPGDLADCPVAGPDGSPEGAGEPVLVTVTPGDRRVVFTLVDAVDGSGDRGRVLYRRECSNALLEVDPVTGQPNPAAPRFTGAPLTNDPTLTDEAFLGQPQGDAATAPTVVRKIADGFRSIETECLDSDPASVPVDECVTIQVTIVPDSARPAVTFQGTRRTDVYCPPGCAPTAAFTYNPSSPSRSELVTFDGSTSSDRRGDYIGDPSNVATRLLYSWSVTGSPVDAATPAADCDTTDVDVLEPVANADGSTPQLATYKFMKPSVRCRYEVELTVTNAYGVTGKGKRVIDVTGLAPIAEITSPIPNFTVVRGRQVQFTSNIQAREASVDGTVDPVSGPVSYWDFGDGTPRQALVPASSGNGAVSACATDAPLCTASNTAGAGQATAQPTHTFDQQGTFTVSLVVTDEFGLKGYSLLTIVVQSEYLYVSEKHGSDTPAEGWCGTIRPVYKACKTIGAAVANAASHDRSDVLVGEGSYPAFTVQPGIDVHGGRDDAHDLADPSLATWAFGSEADTTVTGSEDLSPGQYNRASIRAVGSQTTTAISDLTIAPGDATREDQTAVGVLLDNSRQLTLNNVIVNNGSGVSPTGVLLRSNSQLNIVDSVVRSGIPTDPSVTTDNASDFQRSAYGVRVLGNSDVTVDASTITASPGRPGRNGTPGADLNLVACAGEGSDPRTGSPGASCNNGNTGTPGGAGGGGGGGGGFFSRGKPGQTGGSGSPAGFGGRGGDGGYCVTPVPDTGGGGGGGGAGLPGVASTAGAAGTEAADRANDFWAGPRGGVGGAGQHGGGGGGAGGSGGTYCAGGATGGQGGDGGGGGRGGTGGGTGGWAGGGSFGVYANGGSVEVLNASNITAGRGGRGGDGGRGGRGAHGGAGGPGSQQGKGGDGSAGGGGGGGAGASGGGGGASGPSVGVFVLETSPGVSNDSIVTGTTGAAVGNGGRGGEGGQFGPGGQRAGAQPWPAAASRQGNNGAVGSEGRRGSNGLPGVVCGVYAPDLADGCFSSSVQSIRIPTDATNPTGSTTPQWTVTFSEPVTGLTAANFSLDGVGVTHAGVTAPTPTANPRVWTVGATGVNGNGTLGLMLVNTSGILMSGMPMEDPLPMPFVGDHYEIDQIGPKVVGIVRQGPNPTNQNLLTWYVYFDELVTGVLPGAFTGSPATGGINPLLADITSASPVAGTYAWQVTRNLSFTTGDGTVGLDLRALFNLIKDAAGNELAPTTVVGEVFTVDRTAPHIVSVKRASGPNPSNRTDVPFEVKFSEPVTDLKPADFEFVYTGTLAGGTVTQPLETDDPATADIKSDDGITWTITPRGLTGQGSIGIKGLPTIRDLANNALVETPAPAPNEVFDIDLVKPTTVSIVRHDPAQGATNLNTVTWQVNFDETVTGVTAANFRLVRDIGTGFGPTAGTVTVAQVAGQWRVTATPTGANSTLGLELNNVAGILDQVGNPLATTFVTGESYIIDKIAPTACRLAGHDCATGSIGTAWSNNINGTYNLVLRGTDNNPPGRSGVGRICYTGVADGVTEFNNVCVNEGQPGFTADTGPGQSTLSVNLPFRSPGNWTITYHAVDRAGNVGTPVSESFQLRLDVAVPQIQLTAPPNNARLSSTAAVYMTESGMETPYDGFIRGKVQEAFSSGTGVGGQSGLVNDAVQISIRRMETEQYWNPVTNSFQAGEYFIETTDLTPHWNSGLLVDWTLPFQFPTGGTYEVKARATDLAANSASVTHTVHIDYATAAAVYVAPNGLDTNTGLCPAKLSTAICQPGLGVENGPVKTITRALEIAPGRGRREIVVRTGDYNETVVVNPANLVGGQPVMIRGGYRGVTHSLAGAGLRALPGSSIVNIVGDDNGVNKGTGVILNARAMLQQLRIVPSAPTVAGSSSYAVRANGSNGSTIVNSQLISRPGAAGTDGSAGATGANASASGGGGGGGNQNSTSGGGGGGNGTGANAGGSGGGGGFSGWGTTGGNGAVWGSGGGAGGGGGRDELYWACNGFSDRHSQGGSGGGGGNGGAATAGGNGGSGGAANATWVSNNGLAGGAGGSGHGGGGGGGGGGGTNSGACNGDRGGGGGGGGAGANGGGAGLAGTGGGGSFGVYSYNSTIEITVPNGCAPAVTLCISSANGGAGGKGGNGGNGGAGSNGGSGGASGGDGGSGGGGGGAGGGGAGGSGGGGGAGGPSVGIYMTGSGIVNNNAVISPASGGAAGAAGTAGNRGGNGSAGAGGADNSGRGEGGAGGGVGSQAANGNGGNNGVAGVACQIATAAEGCGAVVEAVALQTTGVPLTSYATPNGQFYIYAKVNPAATTIRANVSSLVPGRANEATTAGSWTVGGVPGYNYRAGPFTTMNPIAEGPYTVRMFNSANGSFLESTVTVDRSAPVGGAISYMGGDVIVPGASTPSVHMQFTRGVDPACTPNNNCTLQLQRFIGSAGNPNSDRACVGPMTAAGTMPVSSLVAIDDGSTALGALVGPAGSDSLCVQYRLVESDLVGNSVTYTGPTVRITRGNHWIDGDAAVAILNPSDATYVAPPNPVDDPSAVPPAGTQFWRFPHWRQVPPSNNWAQVPVQAPGGSATPKSGFTLSNVTATVRRHSTNTYCNSSGCDSVNPVNLPEHGGNLSSWEISYPFAEFPTSGRYTLTVTATSSDGSKISSQRSFTIQR